MKQRPRRPGPGRCTYCLADSPRRNLDHVFPSSWFPENAPADMVKPKVPSCYNCNNRFSAVETDLLLKFMLCFGFDDLRTAGIPAKTLRSVDPDFASNEDDRQHRAGRRGRVLREIAAASKLELPVDGTGVVPGFGQIEPGAEPAVRIPLAGETLFRFNEKLVRGFTLLLSGRLVDSSYEIESGLLAEGKREGFLEKLRGEAISYGPSLLVTRWSRADDPVVSGMEFRIWNRLSLYSVVSRQALAGDPWDAILGSSRR